MNILLIDTSGKKLIVALKKKGIVFEGEHIASQKHLEFLMPQTDKLLTENNIGLNNIDYIAVVSGPGSFTGIRLSVSTVKAIMRVYTSIKCVSLNSLAAMSYAAFRMAKIQKAVCVMPSTVNKYYVGFYESGENFKEDSLLDLEQIKEILKNEKMTVIASHDCDIDLPDMVKIESSSKELMEFAEYKISKGETTTLNGLKPYYLSLSQAEAELAKKR